MMKYGSMIRVMMLAILHGVDRPMSEKYIVNLTILILVYLYESYDQVMIVGDSLSVKKIYPKKHGTIIFFQRPNQPIRSQAILIL